MATSEQSRADHRWMARAVRLAADTFPPPHPNPRVGCVIVKDGRPIGEGTHLRAGTPHAESHALGNCTEPSLGATAYVTLEPCSHFGRTPPCADALINAGIRRVVVGHVDPSCQVAGRGIERLRQAGLEVETGVLEQEAVSLNRGFLRRVETGMPWVTVKLAASIDGRTALASGESRWITSAAARYDVHRLRGEAAAILSSSATVKRDDPLLNTRLEPPLDDAQQPLRVILDPLLKLSTKAKLFSVSAPVLIFHGEAAQQADRARLEAAGVELAEVPMAGNRRLDLGAVLSELGEREINSVWVEAGATMAGAWLDSRLLDELIVYLAPCLLGEAAQPLLQIGELTSMDQRRDLSITDVRRVGEEIRVTAQPR
ncbi:bifunctional diaminohydroxyphosphoribosylaminopyrimidine deaminase/5-amino-6-(5-phosphoribosylamino)uracil reductase RibD [Halorhodospira halochloris]|uniref:bifunctional diaminohydroxyphosphoribosylaminopyrimidine deaminase/5-amino-6-(5-phosphoribosylamino)uracil reductase RibD n=1 Tax=Halorhodospira halochloris TaxID=1052 RepID=UPI00076F6738|nr:bifunctional diaminohydroxyphosphoribosylaminopyrimidine deaminase/5-amino-6-(5-phosphoribosylamino)uracil reductase RibD [Halorhodospira halochloris]